MHGLFVFLFIVFGTTALVWGRLQAAPRPVVIRKKKTVQMAVLAQALRQEPGFPLTPEEEKMLEIPTFLRKREKRNFELQQQEEPAPSAPSQTVADEMAELILPQAV